VTERRLDARAVEDAYERYMGRWSRLAAEGFVDRLPCDPLGAVAGCRLRLGRVAVDGGRPAVRSIALYTLRGYVAVRSNSPVTQGG
jgi:hypothetical protein